VVLVELTLLRPAHHGESAFRIPAQDGLVRHVCKASDRKRPRPHVVRKIIVRRRLRGNAGLPPMRMSIAPTEDIAVLHIQG
jgi:hypothetical protein